MFSGIGVIDADGHVMEPNDPDEATLAYVAKMVGSNHILYASDYPHCDGRFPNTAKFTANRTEFTLEDQRRILHENPARQYRRLK